jgi:hypothetical protein
MGVTGHFVDKHFKINHLLLDFIYVEQKHSGEQLSLHLDKSLTELGIKGKVNILLYLLFCILTFNVLFCFIL